jgi:photosystem II stability/assembly factor-like uncharacterized protein
MLGIVRRFPVLSLLMVSAFAMAQSASTPATPAAAAKSAPAVTNPETKTAWVMQKSGTTASLRGIHALAGGVAWASGTNGTVLRTEDDGYLWQVCTVPKGAEKLDFRGVWAWDANTAIVMSSGPGDASRIYKTTDGCQTWTLKYSNLEEKGFWDTIVGVTAKHLYVLGDPVDGSFRIYTSRDAGETWFLEDDAGLNASPKGEGAFAASNSALTSSGGFLWFGTGGIGATRVFYTYPKCPAGQAQGGVCDVAWGNAQPPMAGGSEAAGVFSVGVLAKLDQRGGQHTTVVAVGGNYEKPAETAGTAAYSKDGGKTWMAAAVPPHGFRSAVAFDMKLGVWIAVGTNGSDFSRDDGKTWQPLEDGNWNALSLPYVVGNQGRIAVLADGAIAAK